MARNEFDAYFSVLNNDKVIEFLEQYRWINGAKPLAHRIDFLKGNHGDPEIRQWLFMAPQLRNHSKDWKCKGIPFGTHERSRSYQDGRFKAYSDPAHRKVAQYLAETVEIRGSNTATSSMKQTGQGVFLFYPVQEIRKGTDHNVSALTMGFMLQFPKNQLASSIRFSVIRPDQPDDIIVDRPAL